MVSRAGSIKPHERPRVLATAAFQAKGSREAGDRLGPDRRTTSYFEIADSAEFWPSRGLSFQLPNEMEPNRIRSNSRVSAQSAPSSAFPVDVSSTVPPPSSHSPPAFYHSPRAGRRRGAGSFWSSITHSVHHHSIQVTRPVGMDVSTVVNDISQPLLHTGSNWLMDRQSNPVTDEYGYGLFFPFLSPGPCPLYILHHHHLQTRQPL